MKTYPSRIKHVVRVQKNTKRTRFRKSSASPPTTHVSAVTGASRAHNRQLITSMINIENAIVSKLAAMRGGWKSVVFYATLYGLPAKRGTSASNDSALAHDRVATGKPCDYPTCAGTATLTRVPSTVWRRPARRFEWSLRPMFKEAPLMASCWFGK